MSLDYLLSISIVSHSIMSSHNSSLLSSPAAESMSHVKQTSNNSHSHIPLKEQDKNIVILKGVGMWSVGGLYSEYDDQYPEQLEYVVCTLIYCSK